MNDIDVLLDNLKKQASEEQELLSKTYAGITPQFTEKTFDNFTAETESEKKFLSVCKDFVFGRTEQRSMLMIGSNGCGKTHMSCAIGNHFISKNKKVRYIKADTLQDQIRTYWNNSLTTEAFIKKLSGYDIVIIDDLGKEYTDKNEMNRQTINQVIDYLYEHNIRFIISTNFNGKELTEKYGTAVLSRLNEACLILDIKKAINDKRLECATIVKF